MERKIKSQISEVQVLLCTVISDLCERVEKQTLKAVSEWLHEHASTNLEESEANMFDSIFSVTNKE